jgi:hypothetical protein
MIMSTKTPKTLLVAVVLLAACQAPPPSSRQLPLRCDTVPRLLAARAAHPRPTLRAGKADGALELRDPFGVEGMVTTSAHFALRVGPDVVLTARQRSAILDTLESAFTRYVVDMRLPAPIGSERYFVNAYIGNSGGGAPPIDFEGAFATVDDEGFPFMVIHPALLEVESQLKLTSAHEFFHTIQEATGPKFEYDEGIGSGWWWEATAEWASIETFPQYVEGFVATYAMQPHISVNYMDYPDTGDLIEYHHYGATIFARYLTEKVAGDFSVVRDTWLPSSPPPPRDVVGALDRILGTRTTPTSVRGIFADFALRNAIWDYERGDRYDRNTQRLADAFGPANDLRVVADLPARGTAGEARVDDARLPWGLAYNVIRVKQPTPGPWTVAFRADAEGSLGDPSAFDVIVARVVGRTLVEAQQLTLADGAGAIDLPEVARGESLLLIVASIPGFFEAGEKFGYTYELRSTAPLPPDMGGGSSEAGGCALAGRSTTTSPLALLAFVALALAIVDRRRRRA